MIERRTCRGVLLTPELEILLMRVDTPQRGREAWITPGGGMKPGESQEQTLRRELYEEVGLRGFEMGPHLWTRVHEYEWRGKRRRTHGVFFGLQVPRFEISQLHQPDPEEQGMFCEFKWWHLDEIEASDEEFVPLRMGELLRSWIENGPPETPVDTGV